MDSTVINIDPQVENQPSNQQTIQTYDSPPDSIDQHTNDQQVHNEPFPNQTPIENQSNIIPPHPKMILTIQSRDT